MLIQAVNVISYLLIRRTLTLLRCVTVVAKSLDDNKKWIRTVSNLLNLIQFQFLCQILVKFSGVKSKRTVSQLRRRKGNYCVVFTNSIKQARQIRKFHVPVVHQWLGNNKKVCCTCKVVVSHNKPIALLLFSFLLRSLLELPVVAIQKFCYHGNVTSYFSSLVSTDYFQ